MKNIGSWKWLKVLLLALVIAGAYLLVCGMGLEEQTKEIQTVMVAGIGLVLAYGVVLILRRQFTWDRGIGLLLVMGCIMRIGYMLYTPCTTRGHDMFELDMNAYGKAGYLLRLVLEGRLPESNRLQLYQQPFFFILGAGCSLVVNVILGKSDMFALVDAAKLVSCLLSCLTMWVVRELFRELKITEKSSFYGMLLTVFTPVFYLTGGRVGEDAASLFFTVSVLLYTLYWEKKPGWKNTIVLAVLYGCGMMTKISIAIPALYTIWIFSKKVFWSRLPENKEKLSAKEYFNILKERENISLYIKMVIFGCISFPLGLWYSVRNYILFGQSLTYVLPQSESGPVYRGMVSLVKRLVLPDIKNLLATPYANALEDYNLFVYMIKTELFGEFTYEIAEWIPMGLLFMNLLISVAVVAYAILLIKKRRECGNAWTIVGWLLLFSCFVVNSYMSYPFSCTMDYRYYSVLTVCKALLLGKLLDGVALRTELEDLLKQGLKNTCILFSLFSVLMYGW